MATKPGAAIRSSDERERQEAARLMGMARTPAKKEAQLANVAAINAKRKAQGWSEETRQKLRDAQQARRDRERLQKEAQPPADKQLHLPGTLEASDKRGPGRPRGSRNKPKEAMA